MSKQYIAFETAKLCYEVGLRYSTNPHYEDTGKLIRRGFSGCALADYKGKKLPCLEQSTLQSILRDGCGLFAEVILAATGECDNDGLIHFYKPSITRISCTGTNEFRTDILLDIFSGFNERLSYTDALEKALYESLKLLK